MRLHLVGRDPRAELPSVEGVLLGWWLARLVTREFRVGVPELLMAPGAEPGRLQDARELRIPRENVVFYEVLR